MPGQVSSRIADWLEARQDNPGARIVDSVHWVPGTYADGFAALTFALLGRPGPLRKALGVSLSRPADSEFDLLAQALIRRVALTEVSPDQRSLLESPKIYAGNALVSNNWAIFRALTRSLSGQEGCFSKLAGQLPCGLFPDSPIGLATPTCYHAKMTATLGLHAVLCNAETHLPAFQRGLKALLALVSPQGCLLPYGRSRNALFAYASAYLALRLGASLYQNGQYTWASQRILSRLRAFQQPDGHVPAVLNRQEWLRQDWDVYINNPDYNAYAAACLLLAERLAPQIPEAVEPEPQTTELGPLLVRRTGQEYFACSTTGEYAPFGSPFFCDTRYAGMVPLIFDDGVQLRLFDQNYCWDGAEQTRSCLVDPRVSEWIPFRRQSRHHYWVRNYSHCSWKNEHGVLRLQAQGTPQTSHPVPRWRRFLQARAGAPARQMTDRFDSAPLEVTLEFNPTSRQLTMESNSARGRVVASL